VDSRYGFAPASADLLAVGKLALEGGMFLSATPDRLPDVDANFHGGRTGENVDRRLAIAEIHVLEQEFVLLSLR